MQAETNESYLIFTIHDRLYAIKNTNVQEIMHSAKIHPLPFVPDYIEGMVNCRGVPYAVVNLLKMEKKENFEIPQMTVLVFRRDDDQFAIHITGIELFFEPEEEDISSEGIKYKSRIIPFFDIDAIETALCEGLREEDI